MKGSNGLNYPSFYKHQDIAPDYYDKNIRQNPLLRIWHTIRFSLAIEILQPYLKDGNRVLDIGCAGGTFLRYFKKRYPKLIFYGIDASKVAVEYAKKRDKKINFLQADAHKLPFQKESFEIITCFDVLEHLENPKKAIFEAKRCLKEKGVYLASTTTESLLFKICWFFWLKFSGSVWEHTHIQVFNFDSLPSLIKSFGLKVLLIRKFHFGMMQFVFAQKTTDKI